MSVVAGVDLGASGGRVIAAKVDRDAIELHEVSRFPNEPVAAGGTLHWDILRLYADVCAGLDKAAAAFPLASAARPAMYGRKPARTRGRPNRIAATPTSKATPVADRTNATPSNKAVNASATSNNERLMLSRPGR